mmetsp:Transcript_5625/g.20471  ORF Transcript_5625/g.20471 Transcript_5625/m.20471 type:complete len:361 (+) Transcript_5625:143-1225(+)
MASFCATASKGLVHGTDSLKLPKRAVLVPAGVARPRPTLFRSNRARRTAPTASSRRVVCVANPAQFPPGGETEDESELGPRWIVTAERRFNGVLVGSLSSILSKVFEGRSYERFWVLETIARIPYFSYMSVLHLYETLGWWRRADYLKIHFAESWNELHHLLIMEELGANKRWMDRFIAQHIAIAYYVYVCGAYALSPRMAYHFSQLVEEHAYETYDSFVKANQEMLEKLPAPQIAVQYYQTGDLYMFDEFQTERNWCDPAELRRPKIETLYDTFINIRDDEAEHIKTMKACQIPGRAVSPHSQECPVDSKWNEGGAGAALKAGADNWQGMCSGVVECLVRSPTGTPRARDPLDVEETEQ